MTETKNIYIKSTACISPHATFFADDFFTSWPTTVEGTKMPAVDPDYKQLIADAGKRRRMGHLIKMGVSTALACLKDEGETIMPDAMMSATGMGGLDDTEKFLRCIIDNGESLLNPSNFIQSTGNTFGGQTGLLLGHHGYNVTYAHGGFSLESALLDAVMQIKDNSINTALVTGADEITETEYEAMRKMGFWRNGRQMGEGSHSVLLSASKENSLCQLVKVSTRRPIANAEQLMKELTSFAHEAGCDLNDVDLILTGCDCDYDSLKRLEGCGTPTFNYKQWCGQYATASGFGLWLGAQLLNRGLAPTYNAWDNKQIKNIIVYTEYRKNDYSFIFLKRN